MLSINRLGERTNYGMWLVWPFPRRVSLSQGGSVQSTNAAFLANAESWKRRIELLSLELHEKVIDEYLLCMGARIVLLGAALMILVGTSRLRAEPNILILFGNHSTLPAYAEVSGGLGGKLETEFGPGLNIFAEYLDDSRFPESEHRQRFLETIISKYSGINLDVVVAVNPAALSFMLENRGSFAQDVPVVFANVSKSVVVDEAIQNGFGGVIDSFDLAATADFAMMLQPEADTIVVVAGSSSFDVRWRTAAIDLLGQRYRALDVIYPADLSFEDLLSVVASLDRRSIVLYLTIFEDANRTYIQPVDALRRLSEAAGAPIYSVYGSAIGNGALGGVVNNFHYTGEALADIVIDRLQNPSEKADVIDAPAIPTVDQRKVERWNIDQKLISSDTVRRFYEPTLWEENRLLIIAVLAVICAQTLTITAFLLSDRRRKRIASDLLENRLQLTHLSRTTQFNQLSGAIAHELNQPLTAILANAEAGRRLLESDSPDLEEIAEILKDISEDDQRAAGIIKELRRLMKSDEKAFETVDLNDIVRSTVSLVKADCRARRVKLDVRQDRGKLPVSGNYAQLQQVVLNLITNAAEAVEQTSAPDRVIVLETGCDEQGNRVLAVSDSGPGVSPDHQEELFEPFRTTKEGGLGFGLSICRAIAERHEGQLKFDPTAEQGARIELSLPPP